MPNYTAEQYKQNAAQHLDNARAGIEHARRFKRAGLRQSMAAALASVAHYRQAYARRMRQSRFARMAEDLDALAAVWHLHAREATHPADAEYCRNIATELEAKASGTRARAYTLP